MEADLDRGWIKHKNTYGFFHQMRIPYHDDYTIRAQLQVIPHPCGFDLCWQQFPDVGISSENDDLSCRVHDRQLVLKVALSPYQPWRTTPQGRPELYINWLQMWEDGRRQYDLQAWIIFHEGSRRPIPNLHLWTENNLVVPGGQFESNRQHH
jgi:hypothetical protein